MQDPPLAASVFFFSEPTEKKKISLTGNVCPLNVGKYSYQGEAIVSVFVTSGAL